MTRYEEIANDLRRRIASGEFGEAGDRIPTLSNLMAEYRVTGVQTMRAAQAILVDEGVLETRHGSGAYIVRVPSRGVVSLMMVKERLAALDQELTAVRRSVDELHQSPDPAIALRPGRSWDWASWFRCDTCGHEGGVTRGWADDELDGYDPLGACREEGHDCSTGIGSFPDADRSIATAVESWWEHNAHTDETARLLLDGDARTAAWHAGQARNLSVEYDGFTGFSCSVTPPSPLREVDERTS